jgi:hypothetical protein
MEGGKRRSRKAASKKSSERVPTKPISLKKVDRAIAKMCLRIRSTFSKDKLGTGIAPLISIKGFDTYWIS